MKNDLITVMELDRRGIEKEMARMKVHPLGIRIMSPKAVFRTVKIKDMPVVSANIIKQDILSFGGEAATSMGTINHSVKRTDVIIFATEEQLSMLTSKLRLQYFGLKQLAEDIEEALRNFDPHPSAMKIGWFAVPWPRIL